MTDAPGGGYGSCGLRHAEALAAEQVPDGNVGGTAMIFGRTWICSGCQAALIAKGVRTFVITGEPA